jgi:hypothetical protein
MTDLPEPLTIDIELIEKYQRQWQIVGIQNPDKVMPGPAMLPWGPPFHKKVVWEGVRPNSTYRMVVRLHAVDKGAAKATPLFHRNGIRVKAYLNR